MSLVYIAHQLTGGGKLPVSQQQANFKKYMRLCYRAMYEGHTVASWAHHFIVEHEFKLELDYKNWLEHCYKLIDPVDQLWVGSNPNESQGVQAEIDYAVRRGIPIVHKYIEPKLALCPFCGTHVVTDAITYSIIRCRTKGCPLEGGLQYIDPEEFVQEWNNRIVPKSVLDTVPAYPMGKRQPGLLPRPSNLPIIRDCQSKDLDYIGKLLTSNGEEIP